MSHHCQQHESSCHNGSSHHCGPSYYHDSEPCPVYYIPCCPTCFQPSQLCNCTVEEPLITLPKEAVADPTTPSNEILIGGLGETKLTLEYLAVDPPATPPLVRVKISSPGGSTTTWEEDPIASTDYHVKTDLPKVDPGSKVMLEVNEAIARLRWCEKIKC